MRLERQLLAALFLLVTAGRASAQDQSSEPDATQAFSWQRHVGDYCLDNSTVDSYELMPRLVPDGEPQLPPPARALFSRPPAQRPGRWTAFTRLAGMFMGRVSALTVGDMRIAFKLEIK
jgi:hypothetical protein